MGRRVLRPRETVQVTGYCDMQLRRMEAAGSFPRRFKLNPDGGPYGACGHDSNEVMAWLEARRASREDTVPRSNDSGEAANAAWIKDRIRERDASLDISAGGDDNDDGGEEAEASGA